MLAEKFVVHPEPNGVVCAFFVDAALGTGLVLLHVIERPGDWLLNSGVGNWLNWFLEFISRFLLISEKSAQLV